MAGQKLDTRTAQMLRCARQPLVSISRTDYCWQGVECRPFAVYTTGRTLIVVSEATGGDPRDASPFDRQNAVLAAFVVAQSMGWPREHELRALLEYPPGIKVEVSVSTHGLGGRISDCLSKLNAAVPVSALPSSLVTYLLGFIRRIR